MKEDNVIPFIRPYRLTQATIDGWYNKAGFAERVAAHNEAWDKVINDKIIKAADDPS